MIPPLANPFPQAPVTYCLNPVCGNPQNPDDAHRCQACGAALQLKERYRALKPLGQGGFGRTFLGRDEHFPGQPACVIKQLYCAQIPSSALAKAQSLFAQEAVRLSELGKHPQIPELLAYFEQDGQFYLVQEFIAGEALMAGAWTGVADPEAHLWQFWRDLLPVLDYVHSQQVVHRDIKPENIMRRQPEGRLVLIDFGIARVLTQTALVGNATIVGTPGFMAPEQMRGKVLPASDLYSLGATCLSLLTGVNPDELFDVVTERWQWREHLPSGMTLSPKAVAILNQLVAPSLRHRAQSARAVLRDLGSAPPASGPSPSQAFPAPVNRSPATEPTQMLRAASLPSPPLAPTTPIAATTPVTPPSLTAEPAAAQESSWDWQPLQAALSGQDWQRADELTGAWLCAWAGRPTGDYLPNGEIVKLPWEALKRLDQLWVQYSRGKFGFSVQVQLYQQCGEQYPLFCDRVGWPVHSPRHHHYLQFNLRRAPRGHLPSRRWLGGLAPWKHMGFLMQRFQDGETD